MHDTYGLVQLDVEGARVTVFEGRTVSKQSHVLPHAIQRICRLSLISFVAVPHACRGKASSSAYPTNDVGAHQHFLNKRQCFCKSTGLDLLDITSSYVTHPSRNAMPMNNFSDRTLLTVEAVHPSTHFT